MVYSFLISKDESNPTKVIKNYVPLETKGVSCTSEYLIHGFLIVLLNFLNARRYSPLVRTICMHPPLELKTPSLMSRNIKFGFWSIQNYAKNSNYSVRFLEQMKISIPFQPWKVHHSYIICFSSSLNLSFFYAKYSFLLSPCNYIFQYLPSLTNLLLLKKEN